MVDFILSKAELMPTGGRIVAICEYQGMVLVATAQHVYRSSDGVNFEQCVFYKAEEVSQ